MLLNENANNEYVRNKLKNMSDDFYIEVYKTLKIITGSTNQETYENVFRTELEYDGICYKEKRPSEIPDCLKEDIYDIQLGPPPWTRFVI